MIELDITENVLERAKVVADDIPLLNNSILSGKGTLAGAIGEVLFVDLSGAKHENTFDYDVVDIDGDTIDVKTKQCSTSPRSYYECSIAETSTHQTCDTYVFMRIKTDLSKGWYLGHMPRLEFFDKARYVKKGDKEGDNGWTATADCYSLPIDELYL